MKKTKSEKIVFGIVFGIFVLYAVYLVIPFVFALNSSLRESGEAFNLDMVKLAVPPYFDNYIKAFNELKVGKIGFMEMVFNSVFYATGATFMSIMSSTFLAYAVSKYDFKLKNFLYSLALFVMIIPIYGSMPATYRLLKNLNFIDSWGYLFSCCGAFGFNFIVIYSFFQSISKDYSEAAFIDGAGHVRVLFQIMLPMAIPSIMAIVITSFIGNWNDYMTPLLYFKSMPTLSSGLWRYEQESRYNANEPVFLAGVVISLIPVVTLFIAFQNTIMQKVYAGGLKG